MTDAAIASEQPSFLDAMVGFFMSRRASPKRSTPSAALPTPVREIGDSLLAAQDLADLKDRAGDAALLPTVFRREDAKVFVEKTASLKEVDDVAGTDLAEVFGKGPSATATAGLRMLIEIMKIIRSRDRDLLDQIEAGAVIPPLSSLLYDINVPARTRMEMLRVATMTPASYAIARAIERDSRVEAWLAKAIADLFTEGVLALAGLVAENAPPNDDHDELPPAFRDEVIARWVAEARASGQDVYFPFGDPDAPTG